MDISFTQIYINFKSSNNGGSIFFSENSPKLKNTESSTISKVGELIAQEVILKPGDVLFTPSFYWHKVENLTDTIGVGYRWLAFQSFMKSSKTQTLLTLLSNNPSILSARKNRHDFSKIFSMSK